MRRRVKYAVVILLTLLALLKSPHSVRTRKYVSHPKDLRDTVIHSAILLTDDEDFEFKAGLNYMLLKKFSDEMHASHDIRLSSGKEDWMDSLRNGSVDIVVADLGDSLETRGLSPTIDFEDSTIWLVRSGAEGKLHAMNLWLASTLASKDYQKARFSFKKNEYSGGRISPYDEIIKTYAAKIGWDWKLIAAVIYHESRFKIGVSSGKGTVGLMQVVARKHSAEYLLDPENNISVGTAYLSKLEKRYSSVAGNDAEARKFALAAFNAGEGRIDKCIKFAAEKGVDTSSWDNVADAISQMPDFDGRQTIAYVDGILSTWYYWSSKP